MRAVGGLQASVGAQTAPVAPSEVLHQGTGPDHCIRRADHRSPPLLVEWSGPDCGEGKDGAATITEL